eukprot:scaffold7758_cov160-Skeletonema_marinoi.AAC.2
MNSIATLSLLIGLIAAHLMCQQKLPTSGDSDAMFHLPHIFPHADAFSVNSFISNKRVLYQTAHSMPVMMMSTSAVAADATHIKDEISYDGTHFSGWTGGNAGDQSNKSKAKPKQQQSNNNNKSTQQTQQRQQSRRSRTLQRKGGGWYDSNNKVRTVDHTIRMALAKIYGNVDPKNIIFEACSRTDAGVHATSLVAQFYCYNDQDPLQSRFVWHLDGSSGRAMGMNGNKYDLDLAMQAAKLFVCTDARDYAAFGSVMRGNEKNRVRSTICTIWGCDLSRENREQLPSWEQRQDIEGANDDVIERCGSHLNMAGAPIHPLWVEKGPQTFTVAITGDRFMYKMVRNIAGTIVAVACGHNELEDIQQALSTGIWGNGPSGSRRICAPAR